MDALNLASSVSEAKQLIEEEKRFKEEHFLGFKTNTNIEIIGHTFKHTTCKGMTCKVLDVCVNGNYKVQQTETFTGSRKKPKIKTCYYSPVYWMDGTWEAID